MKTTQPMLEYLATCSKVSLQSFELARLNDRANLRQHLAELLDELIEVDIQARIAEWILVHRSRQAEVRRSHSRSRRGCAGSAQKLLLPTGGTDTGSTAPDFPDLGANPVLPLLGDVFLNPATNLRRVSLSHSPEKSKRIA